MQWIVLIIFVKFLFGPRFRIEMLSLKMPHFFIMTSKLQYMRHVVRSWAKTFIRDVVAVN